MSSSQLHSHLRASTERKVTLSIKKRICATSWRRAKSALLDISPTTHVRLISAFLLIHFDMLEEELGSEVVFWCVAHVHDHTPLPLPLHRY